MREIGDLLRRHRQRVRADQRPAQVGARGGDLRTRPLGLHQRQQGLGIGDESRAVRSLRQAREQRHHLRGELELLLVLGLVDHLAVSNELGIVDADVVEQMQRRLRGLAPIGGLGERGRGLARRSRATVKAKLVRITEFLERSTGRFFEIEFGFHFYLG